MTLTVQSRHQRWVIASLMALIVASFVVRGLVAAQTHTNSSAFDQRSYLGLGLNIREGRDLSDGKRHPLLPSLLSLLAERDWPYYTKAKLLNVALGALGLLAVFALGRRWFSATVGCLAAAFLSLNPAFVHVSSLVMAEPLLLILTLASWFLMVKTLTAGRRRWVYGLLAGVSTGLAYMTKATALQMVPAFLMAAFWVHRWRIWRRREIWLFALAWLISWLPLLVFNAGEYGNPLYNYNYKHEIFLDSPTQRHFADVSEAPTLQTYLQTHTAADMAYRLWFGIREVTRITLGALSPIDLTTRPMTYELAWILLWMALLIYLASRWRALAADLGPLAPAPILLGLMLLFSLIPLGWFVQASNVGPRFIILFHPMIYIMVLGAIETLLRQAQAQRVQLGRYLRPLIGALLFGVGALVPAIGLVRAVPQVSLHPVAIDRETNARGQQVLDWLEQGTPYGTRVLWGPSYTLPNWIYERRLSLKDVPSRVESLADIQADMEERDLGFVLLDWEMIQRRQQAFAPYFDYDYPYVVMRELPRRWALAYAYDGFPANWLILRDLVVLPRGYEADVRLGETVALLGYELYPDVPVAGEPLYVSLFWQATEATERNYTVFVHVLAGDGQMVAQHDGWPVAGRYPTSSWRVGEHLLDRHDLLLPQDLAGELVQVLVGMYSAETMERLAVSAAGGLESRDGALTLGAWRVAPAGSPHE